MIPETQLLELTNLIQSHDQLRAVQTEVERVLRVVFHDLPRADWNRAQQAAQQILIAELVTRHRGRADGLLADLAARQKAGLSREAALHELAARIHAYYTTPLGIMLRCDLFGAGAVFVSPEALGWVQGRQMMQGGSQKATH
jgi:hypothetical protein